MPQGPGALVTNPNERQMAVNRGGWEGVTAMADQDVSETGMITGIYALFFPLVDPSRYNSDSGRDRVLGQKESREHVWGIKIISSVLHIDDRYMKDHLVRTSTS